MAGVKIPESERLIALEAAMRELSLLQAVGSRYRDLRADADRLLQQLMELGRRLRHELRQGRLTEDAMAAIGAQILETHRIWQRRLEALRASALYQDVIAAYQREDQAALARGLPMLFDGLAVADVTGSLYRPLALAHHRRQGPSPFKTPPAVAEAVSGVVRDGLVARSPSPDWWDADLPALAFEADIARIDSSAALSLEEVPAGLSLFRDGDTVVAFTPRLTARWSVVLAEDSSDTWWEATEGSYAVYRDALRLELEARGIAVRVEPVGV